MFVAKKKLGHIWKLFNLTKLLLGYSEIDSRLYRLYGKAIYPTFIVAQLINSSCLAWATVRADEVGFKIQQGMTTMMFTPSLVLVSLTYFNLKRCEEALQWCEDLSTRFSNECFERAENLSTMIFKVIYYGLLGSSVVSLGGQALFLSIQTGTLVSALGTPPPFGSFWERVVLFLIQNGACMLLVLGNCATFGTTCAVIFYGIASLEHMQEVSKRLGPETDEKSYKGHIQEIVDLHCDVMELLNLLTSLSSYYMGVFEGITYFALLTVWITIFFMNGLVSFAGGCLINISPYFMNTYLNEKLSDTFEDLKDALYDTPWYYIQPKQRRDIQVIMIMADQTKLLHCGPLHVLSYEQLSTILNRVYSYGLSLNELLET